MIDELIPVKVLATHTIANVSEGLAKRLSLIHIALWRPWRSWRGGGCSL